MKNRRKNFHSRPEHEQEFFRNELRWGLIGLALIAIFLIFLLVFG